jgi:L-xylulose reductase
MAFIHSFTGKRVIVTGAGRGIGRALCLKLANELGANVYGISRNPDHLATLKSENPSINTVAVDLADWNAAREAVNNIGAVDYLVNNAGILIVKSFLETTAEDFDTCQNVNLRAVLNVSQVVAQNMIKAGIPGSIVNVSSLSSIRPTEYACAYSLSKAGLDQLTKIMAISLGSHKIRVNSINPISVNTEMLSPVVTLLNEGHPQLSAAVAKTVQRVPIQGVVPMENIVDSILFCLSDSASMMSGVILPLDGGFSAT